MYSLLCDPYLAYRFMQVDGAVEIGKHLFVAHSTQGCLDHV